VVLGRCVGDGATEAVDCRARLDMVGCVLVDGCGRKSKSKVPTRRVKGSLNDRQSQDCWTLLGCLHAVGDAFTFL
jgi:hypothetical protein